MRVELQPDVSEQRAKGLCGRHLGRAAVLDDRVGVGGCGRVTCRPNDMEAAAGQVRGSSRTETRSVGPVEYLDRDLRWRDALDLDLRGLGQLSVVRDCAEKLIRSRLQPLDPVGVSGGGRLR